MSLGFMLIGMIVGLGAGLAVWSAGAGFGIALLAYSGCGALGMALAVGLVLAVQGAEVRHGSIGQPHS
ncbi:MAG: hypothetical protein ACOH2H_20700 [Cypionkella sp.]